MESGASVELGKKTEIFPVFFVVVWFFSVHTQ